MQLRYDEDFVEAAVLHCTTGRRQDIAPLQVTRFHRERERLYAILDPDERNAAFFKLHLDWFREWGLEQLLIGPLRDFPLLSRRLTILAFRRSRGRTDDGAELYVNDTGDRSGVMALRPERVQPTDELTAFLFHEFSHLQDKVDPTFGYHPELATSNRSPGRQRRALERYRLLWDITIDGRMARAKRPTVASRQQRWQEFTNAFAARPETQQHDLFESLWANPVPTHADLEKLVSDPRDLEPAEGPGPGAPCPLCGFPTFSWADAGSLGGQTAKAIRAEFRHWSPEQGACARCLAIYRLNRAPVTG